ncbi:MAG: DUF2284 domain-containing protein [Oscillospiraceae bacterium]|nr:DUF2284 domain-containing protein [Oscillospiraceae bacterium]
MDFQMLIEQAKAKGFSAAVLPTADIVFDPAFRPYCAENLCGQYGANYSCPPDCGTPEEMEQRIRAKQHALVLQTVWPIADYSDAAAIRHAKKSHNAASIRLMQDFRAAGVDCFLAGASGCNLCEKCTILQKEPCRYPDLRFSCLSAYCIYVKDLADKCGLMYLCPKGQVSFFGMILFD